MEKIMWKYLALVALLGSPVAAHDLSADRCAIEDLYLEATDVVARTKGLPDKVSFPDLDDVVVKQAFSLCDFRFEFAYSYEVLSGEEFQAEAAVWVRRSWDEVSNTLEQPSVRILD